MNKSNLLPPKSDNIIGKIRTLELIILDNGDIRIPWVPLEFENLVKTILPQEEQENFLFGPMLCG
ncbi:MAG: hypothetical protein AABZ60_06545 [Planctomycetota bacterium]